MQSNLVDVAGRVCCPEQGCDCLTRPLPPQNCPIISRGKKNKTKPGNCSKKAKAASSVGSENVGGSEVILSSPLTRRVLVLVSSVFSHQYIV